jgi:hypothetical protein
MNGSFSVFPSTTCCCFSTKPIILPSVHVPFLLLYSVEEVTFSSLSRGSCGYPICLIHCQIAFFPHMFPNIPSPLTSNKFIFKIPHQ